MPRGTQTYPTGSTFKPITAMAALEGRVITPGEGLGAGQCISVSTEPFCNAGHADYGAVGLVQALKVSSDAYFFGARRAANAYGDVIQNKAHQLGIGQDTGIDLPSEFEGIYPTRPGASARTSARSPANTNTPTAAARSSAKCDPGASATTCTSPSARATC